MKRLTRTRWPMSRVGYGSSADAYHITLSGGQQQRLALALALVNDPELVFLDEPTTGLDPQARRSLWDVVRRMKGEGRTVVLTTHYMDEAEALCDRLSIMDHGQVIATGTPASGSSPRRIPRPCCPGCWRPPKPPPFPSSRCTSAGPPSRMCSCTARAGA